MIFPFFFFFFNLSFFWLRITILVFEQSSGLMLNEDDEDTVKDGQSSEVRSLTGKGHAESAAGKRSTDAVKAFNAKDTTQADFDDYVLKCKSVFKCRLCPRIVCLTEDTI